MRGKAPDIGNGRHQKSGLQAGKSRIPCTRFVLAGLEALHVVFAQLKPENVRIFLDPGMRHALWQDDESLLQAPSEQDLGRRLVILGRKRFEQRIVAACAADKRRIGLENDTTLCAPIHDIGSSEPGVELYLVDAEDTSIVGGLLLCGVSIMVKGFRSD